MVKRTASIALITRRTGRELNWVLWSEEEVTELLSTIQDLETIKSSFLHIPTKGKVKADPRLLSDSVLRMLWTNEERCREVGLKRKKGNLVVRLERTLLSAVTEQQTAGYEELIGNEEVLSLCEQLTVVDTAKGRLIVAVREGAESFLTSLQPFYRFFLLSALPHCQIQAILQTLHWLPFFEDIHEDRETHRLEYRFPRLVDKEERAITLVLDWKLRDWCREEQGIVIPSLRYVPLESTQPEAFSLTSEAAIEPISWSTVSSDCRQLPLLSQRLQKALHLAFQTQYSRPFHQVYIATGHFPRKIAILITHKAAETLARALTSSMGMEEVAISAAEVVVVEDNNVEISLEAQIWPLSGLVRAYFNVKV